MSTARVIDYIRDGAPAVGNKVTDERLGARAVLAANMELSELVEQLRSVIHNYNGTEVYAVAKQRGLLG